MLEKAEPEAAEKAIGVKLKLLRSIKGLKQKDLADAMGVKFQQVQKYENGTNRVSAVRLNQVMGIFGVDWRFFFGVSGGQTPIGSMPPHYDGGIAEEGAKFEHAPSAVQSQAQAALDFLATDEGIKLNTAFARISDKQSRRKIIDLVITLADSGAESEKSR